MNRRVAAIAVLALALVAPSAVSARPVTGDTSALEARIAALEARVAALEATWTPSPSPTPRPSPTAPAPSVTPQPTAAPTPSPTPTPNATPGGGEFTFADEFSGTTLGAAWGHHYACCGSVRMDPGLTFVADGVLHLRAANRSGQWYSDLVDTRDTFAQTYGIFEARIKTDIGAGLWPSFWLYAGQFGTDGDEIDVVELLGSEGLAAAHQTVHKGTQANQVYAPWSAITQFGSAADWHVYRVEWRPSYIAFSIDGKETWRETSLLLGKPLSILLNEGVGGWAGAANASTPNPAEMLVDWVRVRP